jgi:hypothetical protein
MLTEFESITLGACVPLANAAAAQIAAMIACGQKVGAEFQATLTLTLGQLQDKLAAALKLQLGLTVTPPTIAGQIDACMKMVAALQAQLALGLPVVSIQLAAVGQLILSITSDIAQLNASLAIALECQSVVALAIAYASGLTAALATGGVKAYGYKGHSSNLGPELTSATSNGFAGGAGPTEECVAWVFAASAGTPTELAARSMFVGIPE